MKINQINNYQINRSQKAQTRIKSNPNFEGVKFVLDKTSPSLLDIVKINRNASNQEILNFKNILEKSVDMMSKKINTEIPRCVGVVLKPYFKSGVLNEKIIPGVYTNSWQELDSPCFEILAKTLWPQETKIPLSYVKKHCGALNAYIHHCFIADKKTIYEAGTGESWDKLGYNEKTKKRIEENDFSYITSKFLTAGMQFDNSFYHLSRDKQTVFIIERLMKQPECKAFIEKLNECITLRKSPDEIKEAIAPWLKLPID